MRKRNGRKRRKRKQKKKRAEEKAWHVSSQTRKRNYDKGSSKEPIAGPSNQGAGRTLRSRHDGSCRKAPKTRRFDCCKSVLCVPNKLKSELEETGSSEIVHSVAT